MNGNFELSNSAWPIGYLRANGPVPSLPLYRVVDMRTLDALHSQTLPQSNCVEIAANLNKQIRAGHLRDSAALAEAAADLIAQHMTLSTGLL